MAFFDKDFRKEDAFLYLVSLGLLIFLGWYFLQYRIGVSSQDIYGYGSLVAEKDMITVVTERMKYDFFTLVLFSNSLRSNMSFMIGALLCVLGTMIVIRRLRAEVEFSVKEGSNNAGTLKTSSAGVFITFLGTLIIIAAIIYKDKYEVGSTSAFPITQPLTPPNDSASVQPAGSSTPGSGASIKYDPWYNYARTDS